MYENEYGSKFFEENNLEWMTDHFIEFPCLKVFDFHDTKILSTYLYTINVGPYKIYTHKSLYENLPP